MAENRTRKKTSIGGQALIEGIMMRGPQETAMAVRHVSGEIVMESWPTGGARRAKIWRLPFIRGIFNMADSLRYGYKCLMRSAEMAGLEDGDIPPAERAEALEMPPLSADAAAGGTPEEPVPADRTEPAIESDGSQTDRSDERVVPADELPRPEETVPAGQAGPAKEKKGEQVLMTFLMVLSSLLGVALAVGLFIWLPTVLSSWLENVAPVMGNNILKSMFEGVLRIALFVGYILLVSLMKDIRRVFMYHGAEHKAIFCYENGEELTVENVRRQRRFHPRCGTSFMILILLVGIVISMFIPVRIPIVRTGIKLLTIPLVVGIGYELIKLAGRKDNAFTRMISAPGMWLQHITTKEPDDGMIECAIAALKKVIPEDPDADKW